MTTELDALQQTLAGEHAAVHGYGVLGGRAADLDAPSFRNDLATAYDVHLARRDDLRRIITALGADPVAAEPSYRLPRRLASQEQIATEALRIEDACLQQYAALVAATGRGLTRRWAVTALGDGAVTTLTFGGAPQALPGVTTDGATDSTSSVPTDGATPTT